MDWKLCHRICGVWEMACQSTGLCAGVMLRMALTWQRVMQGDQAGLQKFKLGIDEPPLRQHMAYTGASILADIMADYDGEWISRAEYEEHPQKVLAKCNAS